MHWWQAGILYQVYPRSFRDLNGEGVGDLAGIVARLPYLAEPGGDAIWLSAVLAAMLLLTLRGTPTLHYGNEIGMIQVPIRPDQLRDPGKNNLPGLGLGRDGCRTPMQWDRSPGARFSTAEPWLPLAADSAISNVESAPADRAPLFNLLSAADCAAPRPAGIAPRRL